MNIRKYTSKTCPDCGEHKELSGYFSTKRGNGVTYSKRCKPCHNSYCRVYRKTKQYKDTNHKWSQTDRGKEVRRNAFNNHKKNNPDKYFAQYTCKNAVRDGNLTRGSCEVCGKPNSESHHDDYLKPLHVRWFCKKHHLELHHRTPSCSYEK